PRRAVRGPLDVPGSTLGAGAARPRPDRSGAIQDAKRSLTDFLHAVAQGLSCQKRPPGNQSFRCPRQPEFPRERKVTLAQTADARSVTDLPPASNPLVGVEVRHVVGLGRQEFEGFQGTL